MKYQMAANQTQSGSYSNNLQAINVKARHLHVGDTHNYFENHNSLEQSVRRQFAEDRSIRAQGNGICYSLRAKDAIVTDVTHFEKKSSGSSELIEQITTIRFRGFGDRRFAFRLPGKQEPLCAIGSPVVVVEAENDYGMLAFGVWEKDISWTYYSCTSLVDKWRFWRVWEGVAICALLAAKILLWCLRVRFGVYFEVTPSINFTTILLLVSPLTLFLYLAPSFAREAAMGVEMEEFARAPAVPVETASRKS